MHNDLIQAGWTEEHWNRIVTTVTEEAQKVRVAAQFLPVVGPEDRSATGFADYTLDVRKNGGLGHLPKQRLVTNTLPDHPFTTIAAQVQLTTSEMADPELGGALVKFRRAAAIVSRIEDAVIFNDRTKAGAPKTGIDGIPKVYQVTGGPTQAGGRELGLLPFFQGVDLVTTIDPRHNVEVTGPFPREPPDALGKAVARAIIRSMDELERAGQSRPFACALSPYLYEAVYLLNDSFIAAKDRILPILNGPIVRSSAITDKDVLGRATPFGVVIALGGGPVAIRVASELGVRFLQTTDEPRFLFRVSERLGLRVSDPKAIAILSPAPEVKK